MHYIGSHRRCCKLQLFFYVRHKNVIRTILSFLLTREKTQQQTLQGKGPPKVHNHGAKSNFLTQTFKRTISKVQKNDQCEWPESNRIMWFLLFICKPKTEHNRSNNKLFILPVNNLTYMFLFVVQFFAFFLFFLSLAFLLCSFFSFFTFFWWFFIWGGGGSFSSPPVWYFCNLLLFCFCFVELKVVKSTLQFFNNKSWAV